MEQPEKLSISNTYPTGRVIMAASTGGHLAQLVRIRSRLGSSIDPLWVTFDSPQSRGLLHGQDVMHVPYIAPRDWRSVMRAARVIARKLRTEQFDGAISTGAALALAALPQVRLRGGEALYIESISRFDGPSLTGRLLQAFPGISLRTQHPAWGSRRWSTEAPVLGDYDVVEKPTKNHPPLRIFVTLGTIRPYRFDAMIDAVLKTGLTNCDTVWQIGETSRKDLPGIVREYMTASEFQKATGEADVVITHAGVGSILNLLDAEVFPIIIPRDAGQGEHVDNHQHQIARFVDSAELGISRLPRDLSEADVVFASTRRVRLK